MIDLSYIFQLSNRVQCNSKEVNMTLHESRGAVINLNCDLDNSIALKAEGTSILGRPYISTLSHSLLQYKEAIRNVYLGLTTHTSNILDLRVDSNINGYHITLNNKALSKAKSEYSPINVKIVDADVEGVDYYFVRSSSDLQKNTYRKSVLNAISTNFKADIGLYTDMMCLLSKCEFPNMKILFNTNDNIKFINKHTKESFSLTDDLNFLTDAEFNLLYMIYSYTLATGGRRIEAGSSSLIIQFINMGIFEGLIDYQNEVIAKLEKEEHESANKYSQSVNKLKNSDNTAEQISELVVDGNNDIANLTGAKIRRKNKDLTEGGKRTNQLVTALDGLIDIMKLGNVLIHIYNIPDNYTGKYKKISKVIGASKIDFSSMDEDIIANSDIGNNIVANYVDWKLPILPKNLD